MNVLNVTLKQLRYIEAAGRLGSISGAAQELNISQSSVSAAIDALEENLSYDLFLRTPAKGVQATPAGVEAMEIIREFLDQHTHFRTELLSIGGEASGAIRIACFVAAVGLCVPPILQRFQAARPLVKIELFEETLEGVVSMVNQGMADIAFTYADIAGNEHDFAPLVDVPPYALVSKDDPIAAQNDVSLAELSSRPMVLFDLPQTTGYYLRFMTGAGHDVAIAHKTDSVEMVRTLVASGFGFSILNARPQEYREGVSNYCIRPIRDDVVSRPFGILRKKGMRQPRIVRAFVDMCIEQSGLGAFEVMTVRSPVIQTKI